MAMYQNDGRGSYPRDFLWLVKWILILTVVGVLIGMMIPQCGQPTYEWNKVNPVKPSVKPTPNAGMKGGESNEKGRLIDLTV